MDKLIVENKPWSLAAAAEKGDAAARTQLDDVLYTAAEALRIVTVLAHPVLPDATRKIWAQLGLANIEKENPRSLAWGGLKAGTPISETSGVFPRAEKGTVERMQKMEELTNPAAGEAKKDAPAPAAAVPATDGKITIEDFMKVELRVGLVKVAERVKGADKLLRLEVDIGTEVRQILAGIALAYEPEKLVGRKVVIVANLAPRRMRGLESNGMILAASVGDQGLPVLTGFLEDVVPGAKVK